MKKGKRVLWYWYLFNRLIVSGLPAQMRSKRSPKEEVKGPDVGWERNTLDNAFLAEMPLMVALFTVILVNSRRWAAEIHTARIIPHVDRSELV